MARVSPDQPLIPSVLDRLLDEEPGLTTEPARLRHQVLSGMHASLERDLRNLLNTRWRCRGWPSRPSGEVDELAQSLVQYGTADLAAAHLGSAARRQTLCRELEAVIRTYEPRLQNVTVRLQDEGDPLDGVLHFRISALLRVHPSPEPVAFEPALELGTGKFKFKEPDR